MVLTGHLAVHKERSWKISVTEDWMQPMKRSSRRRKQHMPTTLSATLPGGYQMELNEEASNVSQGQKQLLDDRESHFSRQQDTDP